MSRPCQIRRWQCGGGLPGYSTATRCFSSRIVAPYCICVR
jgi:hypothetical protein